VKKICVVCEREYVPNLDRGGKFALIYCSGECAMAGKVGRSVENLQREHRALAALLKGEEPS
jgi:hypothetical protein